MPVAPRVTLDQVSDAPEGGLHRVDPSGFLRITATVAAEDAAADGRLVETLPDGWTVDDAGGGDTAIDGRTVTWTLGDLVAGSSQERTVVLRAPALADGTSFLDAVFGLHLDHATGTVDGPDLAVRVAPRLVGEDVAFGRIAPVTHQVVYLAPGAPLLDVQPLDTFRVRMQVRNPDQVDLTIVPWLEVRALGAPAWTPLADGQDGPPIAIANEWRPAPGGRGTVVGPAEESIATGTFRFGGRDGPTQYPVPGRRLMEGATPPRLTLPGDTVTEIEFTVRPSIDAPYTAGFEVRLTDAGEALPGAVVGRFAIGAEPPLRLSPGQQDGVDVPEPDDAAATAADAAIDFPLRMPLSRPVAIEASYTVTPSEPRYQLAAPFDTPHAPGTSLVSDTCAACHRGHTAAGPTLLAASAPQSTLCFTCHDGAGSDLDVQSQYTDPAVPADDPATRSYYRHDALAPSIHIASQVDEFGGTSNRHSACGDCHNSHNATAALSTQTATGWTVAGAQAALSGVAVTNGAAGTAPTYTLRSGAAGSQPTREYEVCFKCHSGWTVLPSNVGQPPSRQALDKAIEFNPANTSFHPIEAPGTNATAAMAENLSGTSPYKQWDFTPSSTIRCVNCHGDPRKYDEATPPDPGSDLAPHTSQYRGILLQNYRDRLLKPATQGYAAADFALCYLCHAEEPFLNEGSSATNFRLHREHVVGIAGEGSGGTDIDVPGAGQGNAVCAECHFRIHSTALRVGTQTANPRLINFAPNVLPLDGTLSWSVKGDGGSCTLLCHGKDHNDKNY